MVRNFPIIPRPPPLKHWQYISFKHTQDCVDLPLDGSTCQLLRDGVISKLASSTVLHTAESQVDAVSQMTAATAGVGDKNVSGLQGAEVCASAQCLRDLESTRKPFGNTEHIPAHQEVKGRN